MPTKNDYKDAGDIFAKLAELSAIVLRNRSCFASDRILKEANDFDNNREIARKFYAKALKNMVTPEELEEIKNNLNIH